MSVKYGGGDSTLTLMSLLVVLIGRFLSHIFLVFQILAVRCAYDSAPICLTKTDQPRFILNLLGIALTLLTMYYEFSHLYLIFP